jgi:hypothetical protein
MRLPAITCAALLTLLAGCGEPRRVVVAPTVPPDLLVPVEFQCPEVQTEGDVARCLIRQAAALRQANGQIAAIAEIVLGAQ